MNKLLKLKIENYNLPPEALAVIQKQKNGYLDKLRAVKKKVNAFQKEIDSLILEELK